MRQSIEVRNSMKLGKNETTLSQTSRKKQTEGFYEDGDKVPHRNREVSLTYEGDEHDAIKVDLQDNMS